MEKTVTLYGNPEILRTKITRVSPSSLLPLLLTAFLLFHREGHCTLCYTQAAFVHGRIKHYTIFFRNVLPNRDGFDVCPRILSEGPVEHPRPHHGLVFFDSHFPYRGDIVLAVKRFVGSGARRRLGASGATRRAFRGGPVVTVSLAVAVDRGSVGITRCC